MDKQRLSDKSICAAIIKIGHELINKRLVAGSWGNISCRINKKCLAITPSGYSYELLTPDDIMIIDNTGKILEGRLVPSSESKLHTAIYNAYPEAQAIIHTHSVYATVLAVMHKGIPSIIEDVVQIIGGSINCAEYAMCGTQELADNAVKALDGRRAVLLANHGAVCWGKNLQEALLAAEILEKSAKIAVICMSTGAKMYEISNADVTIMHNFYEQHYSKRQQGKIKGVQ